MIPPAPAAAADAFFAPICLAGGPEPPARLSRSCPTPPRSWRLAPRRRLRKAGAPARVVVAFFLAGFATFSLLYCVQPLLPVFARDFRVGPAESSLALSLATSALAVSILCAAAVSEAFGRRGLMFVSMATAAVLNAAAALAPGWTALLACRAAEGLALGGVPAVAMAYLAEEIEPKALGAAMGVYVGGTALGGMSGRLVTGVLTDLWGWRAALGGIGAAGLLAALGFLALLPPSRNFAPRRGLGAGYHVRAWLGHLGEPAMLLLYAVGFLAMGAFVAVYNYAGFRLTRPPFALSQTELGFIFTAYLFGVAASWAAGRLGGRFGRAGVMAAALITAAAGAALTLAPSLPAVIARDRAGDDRLLRRPLDRQRLGRAPGRAAQGPRRLALPSRLLRRLEPDRLRRRLVLVGGGMAGRGRLCSGAPGARPRGGAGAKAPIRFRRNRLSQ